MHSNAVTEQINVVALEERAARVVACIQEFVQVLRSVEEFAPSACIPLENVDLFAKFEQLFSRIHILVESIPSVQLDEISMGDFSGKRYNVVRHILWPLAACLGQRYAALDELPPETAPLPSRVKPPPPPGLLSIQNYTDIAALMEFLVCTSILPLLQRDILSSTEERVRHFLPKSLAGRIPRRSLLWGCAVQNATTSSERSVSSAIVELRTTVASMGRVVLLDRFRPMLLPRHMADLFAAIFQADALQKRWNQPSNIAHLVPSNYPEVLQILLSGQSSTACSVLVDPYTQARAYQILLLRGTKAPLWLRQRVSLLLTGLACRDITAIVHVFVSSVSSGDMTGASLRLARALMSVAVESRDSYFAALSRQLLILLDAPGGGPIDAPLDQSRRAGVLTVWAVLDQLPLELSMKHIFPLVAQDLLPSVFNDSSNEAFDRYSVHKTVRRIGFLLSSLPPSYNAWKLSRLLLSPMQDTTPYREHYDGAKVMILSQLLRIASIESADSVSVKVDAVFALQCVIQTAVRSSFPIEDQPSLRGDEIVALALVYGLAPTALDLEGYRYNIPVGGGIESGVFQAVTLEQLSNGTAHDLQSFIHDIERRAKIIVEDVFIPMTMRADKSEGSETRSAPVVDEKFRLPSIILHLLLICYFSTAMPKPRPAPSRGLSAQVGMPNVYQRNRVYIQLAVMILLPLICEQCSLESLLLPDGSGSGILSMVKLILDCTSSIFGGFSDIEESRHSESKFVVDEGDGRSRPFHSCSGLLLEILKLDNIEGDATEQDSDLPLEEALISTSSVVLTLMVTMLELGSQKRPDEEEVILRSMLPSLAMIARFSERSRVDKDVFSGQPELAEMASHAMALIAARSHMPSTLSNRDVNGRSKRQMLMDTINEAENDLRSEQPPIRARGVVLLGRMAQTYLRKMDDHLRERPLVEVLDRSDENDDDDRILRLAVAEIVRVSVIALADMESYVYLAAVQSIVTAADVSPREVIPLIGGGICTGIMPFPTVSGEDEPRMTEIRLTTEQRIKLTEALLFTIRRRGRAVYDFVPLLMSLMLYGIPPQGGVDPPLGLEAHIQEKTHRYFVPGNEISQHDGESVDLSRTEFDLRIRTGGPIFQSEENDVLRAGCISVLSELVSTTLPTVIARYCRVLMVFATNALKLDASRPVRRATAMLCTELYDAVLLEHDEAMDPTVDRSFKYDVNSLALEMISSDEEALHAALRRCVDVKDVVANKVRLYDPATAERCKEALTAREEAARLGVLAAAKFYVASNEQETLNPVVDIIRARLNEK